MTNESNHQVSDVQIPKKKVKKQEMVDFLVSGGIKQKLAEGLYDQGLNNWDLLVNGEKEYFLSLEGIGEKNALKLLEVAGQKKKEFTSASGTRTLREILEEVPRLGAITIDRLFQSGYTTLEALKNASIEDLVSIEGVGKRTAERIKETVDLELAKVRSIGAAYPDLFETLRSVPRMTQTVISELKENGFDRYHKFKDLEAERLQELRGIGPKLSDTIIQKVNETREKYGIDDSPEAEGIEEASVMIEDVAPAAEGSTDTGEKGFFQKLVDGIKSLFKGKKEQPAEEVLEEGTGPSEEIKEEVQDEEKEDEVPVELSSEGGPDEAPEGSLEMPTEDPVSEPEEGKEGGADDLDEPTEEAIKEEVSEKVDDISDVKEEGGGSMGFFQRIKTMFSRGKKEEVKENEVAGDAPEEPFSEHEDDLLKEEEDKEPEQEEKEAAVPTDTETPDEKTDDEGSEGPLKMKGIPVKVQEKLVTSGYKNIEELKEAVPEDLVMVEGIDNKTAEQICKAVKDR